MPDPDLRGADPAATSGAHGDRIDVPRRRRRAWRAARAAGYAVLLAALLFGAMILVEAFFLDVRGWMRRVLCAACTVFAIGLALHLRRAAARERARRRGEPVRPWDARWIALMGVGAAVVLFAGWMPQQRINADAARPRTWPEKTDRLAMFGMTSRWAADSVRVVLTVRCPGAQDCIHSYGGVSMSFRADDFAWGHIYPYEFTRTGPGTYRAEFGMPFGGKTYRHEYLAATGWGAYFLPPPRASLPDAATPALGVP